MEPAYIALEPYGKLDCGSHASAIPNDVRCRSRRDKCPFCFHSTVLLSAWEWKGVGGMKWSVFRSTGTENVVDP